MQKVLVNAEYITSALKKLSGSAFLNNIPQHVYDKIATIASLDCFQLFTIWHFPVVANLLEQNRSPKPLPPKQLQKDAFDLLQNAWQALSKQEKNIYKRLTTSLMEQMKQSEGHDSEIVSKPKEDCDAGSTERSASGNCQLSPPRTKKQKQRKERQMSSKKAERSSSSSSDAASAAHAKKSRAGSARQKRKKVKWGTVTLIQFKR